MHFFEKFYKKTIRYELINKFNYKNLEELPELKKIILNFGCKSADIKQLSAGLLAFELILNQKGKITETKHSNIVFKIRRGNPTGCKITLSKFQSFHFFNKLINEIFPKLKNFFGLTLSTHSKSSVLSFVINETFCFYELEKHYYLFNTLPKLNITIITKSTTKQEMDFLLSALKLPFKP